MGMNLTINAALTRMRLSGEKRLVSISNAMLAFKVIETRRIPVAGTDGVVMLFNPDAIATFSFEEVVGLCVHELLHVKLKHPERFELSVFDNHLVSNFAMDDEINAMVLAAGYQLPLMDECCFPKDHDSPDGLPWELYYGKRLAMFNEQGEEQPQPGPQPQPQPGSGAPSNDSGDQATPGDGTPGEGDGDSGDADDDADGGSAGGSGKGNKSGDATENGGDSGGGDADADDDGTDGNGGGGDPTSGNSQPGSGSGGDGGEKAGVGDGVHKIGELAKQFAPELLEDGAPSAAEQAEKNRARVNAETRNTKLHEVTGGESHSARPADQAKGEPVVLPSGDRWQDVVVESFRRTEATRVDWSRRSRRMQPRSKGYIPGKKRTRGQSIALVLDISGSCTRHFDLWESLANELVDELDEVTTLELIYHNTNVVLHQTWERHNGYEVILDRSGTGGTSHIDALNFVDELDVDSILMFTDCETYWPDDVPDLPCVTVIPPSKRRTQLCPFGVNVRV